MVLTDSIETVPLRSTADGRMIYVGKSRVPLETVIEAFHRGETPETIVSRFPVLKLADVYLVIGYYLNHRDEVDQYVERAEAERQHIQQENEARFPAEGLKERLLSRRSEQE